MNRLRGAFLVLIFAALTVGCTSLRTDCTIGVVGTAATITIQGLGAGQTCGDILKNPQTVLGGMPFGDRNSYYELTQAPTQPVICEYAISNQRFIVRDEGVIMLVGNLMCASLKSRAQ